MYSLSLSSVQIAIGYPLSVHQDDICRLLNNEHSYWLCKGMAGQQVATSCAILIMYNLGMYTQYGRIIIH